MKEPIRVYEHEALKVGVKGFNDTHLKLLSKFLGDKGEAFPYYSLINHGVKFKHYVGVISVGNIQIEVLPKADKNAGERDQDLWEDHLLAMLRAVYKLKVKLPSNAEQQVKHSRLLDVFLNRFMDEVERIMHIGLVKAYRRIEDSRTSLKGRLVMSKHIVKNIVHQERFYVEYTTYDRNHIFNRLIYKALRAIQDIAASNDIILRAKRLEFEFPELEDIVPTEALFNRLTFDRKTEDYREAIELAKMILLNYMPNMTYQRGNSVVALMFNMNDLWEEYVYITLKRQLTKYTVSAQRRKTFWGSDEVDWKKIVKPDIVIQKDGKSVAVLDTKWKIPSDGKPGDADLKQMFVYHKYWNTNCTALLYPGTEDSVNVKGYFIIDKEDITECKCSMIFLPISSDKKKGVLDVEGITSDIQDLASL